MARTGEDRLVAWLRRRLGPGNLLGDDAAILPISGPWAVTVDGQIAGVHVPEDVDPAVFARRLLAVNLSDLAAAGASPAYAFLALQAPPGFDHRRFFSALVAACRRFAVNLAGGDLATHPDRLAATLTLLGRRPVGNRWLARRGASPDQVLWVGGTLGESAAGAALLAAGARFDGHRVALPSGWEGPPSLLAAARRSVRRHLLPQPQLELGLALGRLGAGAAIDLSDGLARDLRRLAAESGVGAVIDAGALPLSTGFEALCRALRLEPLEIALGGGEDYVLLFTLPEGTAPPAGSTAVRIGVTTARRRLILRRNGRAQNLPAVGWDHFDRR